MLAMEAGMLFSIISHQINEDKIMIYDYSNLKWRIRETYDTQENFAKTLGISKANLSAKLNSLKKFSQSEINKMHSLLSVRDEEIGGYFFTPTV